MFCGPNILQDNKCQQSFGIEISLNLIEPGRSARSERILRAPFFFVLFCIVSANDRPIEVLSFHARL